MKLGHSQLCCFLLVGFCLSSVTGNSALKGIRQVIELINSNGGGTEAIDVTHEDKVKFLDEAAVILKASKMSTEATAKKLQDLTADELAKEHELGSADHADLVSILEESKEHIISRLTGLEGTPAEEAYLAVRAALATIRDAKKYTLNAIKSMEDALKVAPPEPSSNTWLGLDITVPEVLLEVSESTTGTAAATVKLNSKRQRIQHRMQRQALARLSLSHKKSSTRNCQWCERMGNAFVDAVSRYFSSAKFPLIEDARFYANLPYELPPFHSAVQVNNEAHRVLWDTGAEHLYLTDANFQADNGQGSFLFGAKRAGAAAHISHVELNAVLMTVPAANTKILWDNHPVKQMDAFLSYRAKAPPTDITVNYGVSGALGKLTLDTLGRHRCIRFHRNGNNGYIHWGTKCPQNHFVHVPTAGLGNRLTEFTLKGRAAGQNNIADAVTLTIQPNGALPISIQNGGDPATFPQNGGNGVAADSGVSRLILDTGAGPMLGPRQTVHRLHQIICAEAGNHQGNAANCIAGYNTGYANTGNPLNGLAYNAAAGLPSWADFSVDCGELGTIDELPIVRFGIDVSGGTQEYVLTANDYVIQFGNNRCVIGFLPLPDHAHMNGFQFLFGAANARNAWLMGDTFFRNRDTFFQIAANGDYSTHLRLAA
eukprot:GILJ01012648.1.p1 GENE.GILJ01012648.1~~GILJ01012648.1.p1  ORF type:complete len:655 (-),score=91.91 GILJ01012648.1:151-2115(-)